MKNLFLLRTIMAASLAILLAGPAAPFVAAAEPEPLYKDPAAPLDKRVTDLISRLTLEEKATLLNHRGPTVKRFDIRADQWNQCLNGVKWNRPTTLFPTCIALSATWDNQLVHDAATVLSEEARAIYNGWHLDPNAPGEHKGLIYRAPVINIERNPYWGRNHEAWGEDPYLTGRMAVAYVRGLQGDDRRYLKIAATLKHFAVNNVESDRQKLNAVVPERMLREYWLPHWRDAVVEGKALSLMASYNAINGTPNNINHWLLTDLLKGEWNHEGFVVSDLGGVKTMVEGHAAKKMTYEDAVAQSVMAGCDFSDKEYEENIPGAVHDGKLSEARLDDSLARVLRVRFRLGEFDSFDAVPYSKISPAVIDSAPNRALALKAAQESIVLLQNRDHLLPLDRNKLKRIAVIGPLADQVVLNNYNGTSGKYVTALQGIKDRAVPSTEIRYASGATTGAKAHAWIKVQLDQPIDEAAELKKAADLAGECDVAIVFVGTNAGIEQEGRDRKTLGLTGNQEALVKAVQAANPHTIVVQMSAGPLTVPWLKDNVPAMLQAWWPGAEGGHAIADVLFGDVNPGGHLPHTVYASEAQVPPQDEYDISKGFTYMYVKGEPLFPFGHGLSYTTFSFSDLKLSQVNAKDGDTITMTLDVANTGTRDGEEVVQVYVHEPAGNVVKPRLRLVGFRRVAIKAGTREMVSVAVEVARMRYWDETSHAFIAEPGTYELKVGSSSADLPLSASFSIGR